MKSSKFSEANFSVKYLKSSSDKFLTILSRLEFINCILPIKTKFLFKKNTMYFSSPWIFFSQLKIYVTVPLCCTSKLSSYVIMISNFFIIIIDEFSTNPTRIIRLKLFFFYFIHDQIFVKMFFQYFFAALMLFKNCFNKFISSIFTPKNNNWLTKAIISTNNFLSKTTRNVSLIFFVYKPFNNF